MGLCTSSKVLIPGERSLFIFLFQALLSKRLYIRPGKCNADIIDFKEWIRKIPLNHLQFTLSSQLIKNQIIPYSFATNYVHIL